MLNQHIKASIRKFKREKVYFFASLAGLAIAGAAVLAITSFVGFERSYDRFHKHQDRIYRVTEIFKDDGETVHSAMTHAPLGEVLNGRVSGIEHWVRILPYTAYLSTDDRDKRIESSICFVDSAFFKVFSFKVIEGNSNGLTAPFSILLTRKKAIEYFGSTEVIGKQLQLADDEKSHTFFVVGVVDDVPENSHIKFDFLISFSSLDQIMPWYNNWHHPPTFMYVLRDPLVNSPILDATITREARSHQPDEIKAEARTYQLQELLSIHLYSSLRDEWNSSVSNNILTVLSWVSVIILFLAIVNFVNLSTAQAIKRTHESGIRKALGASQISLAKGFIIENALLIMIGLVAATGLSKLIEWTILADFIDVTQLRPYPVTGILPFIYTLLVVLSIILISCFYQLLAARKLKPFEAIKGGFNNTGNFPIRKILISFQFFVAGLLLTVTMIMIAQIDYLQTKNLGFKKDEIVVLPLTDKFSSANYQELKSKLLQQVMVKEVCLSSGIPGFEGFYGHSIKIEGRPDELIIEGLGVDEDFVSTFGLNIPMGRDFSRDIASDQREAFIINESAVRMLGLENPIGKELEMTVYIGKRDLRKGKIIGVVSNFNYRTLHTTIEPLLLYINKHVNYADFLSVRLASGTNPSDAIKTLALSWQSFNRDIPFGYYFLDERISTLYQKETMVSKLVSYFSILSLIISSLGLFAISAYYIQHRMKEASIRKVMGATALEMWRLLIKEYVLLVLLVMIIVVPLAWSLTDQWLSGFAYRINPSVIIFLASTALMLAVVILATAYHTLRATFVNPVKFLRQE